MKNKQGKFLQQTINALLVLIVIGMLGWLSIRYKTEFDWTAGHRNTLTEGSRKLLSSMKGPIRFTAFLYPDANRADYEQWFDRYKQFKSDVDVQFVDPSREPKKVEEYQVTQKGQVVVEYQGRKEKLGTEELDERSITGALQRLASTGDSYVVFLEGHGERAIAGSDTGESKQTDYVQFAAALRDKGLKVESVNLTKTPAIPDNTSVLVIASPTHTLLPGEAKIVNDYVAAGGDLLWMTDPDQPTGLDDVAKSLGVTWLNGSAIFPNYAALGLPNPAIYLGAPPYPSNPVTTGFEDITVFPLARALKIEKVGDWQSQPLLVTDKEAWLESGPLDKQVSFDEKSGDIAGPLNIAMTLTRQIAPPAADKAADAKPADTKPADGKTPDAKTAVADPVKPEAPKADAPKPHEQRIALIGDSDFLADAYLDAQGNKSLGLSLLQWLAARDNQINVDVPKAPDTQLYLPGWVTWVITAGFVLILPLLLIGIGVTRWLVRRRK